MFNLTKKAKPKARQFVDTNPVEAITNIGSGVLQSFGTDLLTGGKTDLWNQFLGIENKKENTGNKAGDLEEGKDLNLASIEKNKKHDVAPGIDYRRDILYGAERIGKQQTRELEQQIEMIVGELKRLAASSKELEIAFKDVVVTQNVVKPGKYHQSFFEWMLIILKTARMRIEDAGAWLSVMHGKKNKKQQQNYWQMLKKHGTNFGLSNERVVATQTG